MLLAGVGACFRRSGPCWRVGVAPTGGGWLTLAKFLFAEVKFYLLYKKYKVDHIIPIIYIKNE
jgi:hypothetical protein